MTTRAQMLSGKFQASYPPRGQRAGLQALPEDLTPFLHAGVIALEVDDADAPQCLRVLTGPHAGLTMQYGQQLTPEDVRQWSAVFAGGDGAVRHDGPGSE